MILKRPSAPRHQYQNKSKLARSKAAVSQTRNRAHVCMFVCLSCICYLVCVHPLFAPVRCLTLPAHRGRESMGHGGAWAKQERVGRGRKKASPTLCLTCANADPVRGRLDGPLKRSNPPFLPTSATCAVCICVCVCVCVCMCALQPAATLPCILGWKKFAISTD